MCCDDLHPRGQSYRPPAVQAKTVESDDSGATVGRAEHARLWTPTDRSQLVDRRHASPGTSYAPVHHRAEDGPQVLTLLGEVVLEPWVCGVALRSDDSQLAKPAQAVGEDVDR